MKSFFKKFILYFLSCAVIAGSFLLFACNGCDDDLPTEDPPKANEIDYYAMPDNMWLRLSYSGGEVRNYIKFKGNINNNYHEIYYFDSVKYSVPSKECVVRITEGVYHRYEWQMEGDDISAFRWVKIGGNLDKKAAGIAAYDLFNILFSGTGEGDTVTENLEVDGNQISCKKYSQLSAHGTTYYWRPEGFDFWIKSQAFDLQGNPFEVNAVKLDMQLSSLPDFVVLP